MAAARWGIVVAMALCMRGRTALPGAVPGAQTEYAIVVTGTPLLHGAYADQHTQFLTRTLAPLGARCVVSITLADDREALLAGLAYAAGKASLILVTGGLGPTIDDITREVLSEYTGIALRQQPDLLERLKQRLARSGGELPPGQQRQALTPAKGTYLPNANGTAVGLVFDGGERIVVALPGPPRELQPMVKNELVPYLLKRFGLRSPGASMTLRFAGVGQSRIDQVVRDHGKGLEGATISSTVSGAGRVDFSVEMKDDREEDRARLKGLKEQLVKQLGEFVYSEDGSSLEQTVLRRLEGGSRTLSLVEIASGGAVAASLGRGGARPGFSGRRLHRGHRAGHGPPPRPDAGVPG